MRDKPNFDRGGSNRPDATGMPVTVRRARKLPAWLVNDITDQEAVDWDTPDGPPIKRYPGWICVLIVVGGSAGLWWIILKGASVMLGGPK